MFTMSGKDAEGDDETVALPMGARWGFGKPVGVGEMLRAIRGVP